MSMTSYILHTDPAVFPEPEEFRPERWLTPNNNNIHLDKLLIPFGRGSRICLGMNLAYAELYLGLAAVFGRFKMRLFETRRREDVDVVHDFVAGSPSMNSKGVRVMVTGERK